MNRKEFLRLIILSPLTFFIPKWLLIKKKLPYGFKTFSYSYKAPKGIVAGGEPAMGYFKNFGMLIPQDEMKDSKVNRIPVFQYKKIREYAKEYTD